MPLNVSDLNKERVETPWDYKGEELTLVFNPAAYTPALEDAIEDAVKGSDFQSKALIKVLCGDEEHDVPGLLISLGGIVNADGSPWEATAENLAKLPVLFLVDLLEKIQEGVKPDPTTPSS